MTKKKIYRLLNELLRIMRQINKEIKLPKTATNNKIDLAMKLNHNKEWLF